MRASVSTLELNAFRGLAADAGVKIDDGLMSLGLELVFPGDGTAIADTRIVFDRLAIQEPPGGPISTYLQHTHPSNVYYDDIDEWRNVSKAHTAIHASFPKPIRWVFHFIMEHSVHHLRPGVPEIGYMMRESS